MKIFPVNFGISPPNAPLIMPVGLTLSTWVEHSLKMKTVGFTPWTTIICNGFAKRGIQEVSTLRAAELSS